MKKVLSTVLAIILAVSVIVGCSSHPTVFEPDQTVLAPNQTVSESNQVVTESEQDVSETNIATSEAVPKVILKDSSGRRWFRIGMIAYHLDSGYTQLIHKSIWKYFSELDTDTIKYDFTSISSERDMNEQLSQIDEFIEKNYDVIIVELVEPSMAIIITEKAKAADIPIVYICRESSEEGINAWDKVCFVGTDLHQIGTIQGEIVADLPDNGDIDGDGIVRYVMIMGDPENIDAQYRSTFPIKALTDRGIEVEELFKQNANWDQEEAQKLATTALEQFGYSIDVIFCNNDGMALGAYQAIAEAGRTVNKDIYLLGIDAFYEIVEMINDGQMTGTVYNDVDSLAEAAAEAAFNYIEGKQNDKYTWIDFVPIVAELE